MFLLKSTNSDDVYPFCVILMYLQAGGLSEWFYFWTFPSLLFTVVISIERVHVHWRHCLLHHEVREVLITIYSDGFILTCVLHRQSIERTDIES